MLKRLKRKLRLTFASENLAVPEIHTNEVENTDETDEEPVSILYDNLAIPEVQFLPHKKSDE